MSVALLMAVCALAHRGLAQSGSAQQPSAPPAGTTQPATTQPAGTQPGGIGEDTEHGSNAGPAAGADKPKEGAPSGNAQPPKIVVVVSKSNPTKSLTVDELRRIFLRQRTQWRHGRSITVYERPADNPIRQAFSRRMLGKKPIEFKEYWMNLQLTRGLKPPKILRSAKLVKRYLERVRGGIAYIYEDEADDTVKVVEIRGAKRADQRP